MTAPRTVDIVTPNSGHGLVRPRPDGVKGRCGGPALCATCRAEVAAIEVVPGGCGSTGPFPAEYADPHVYARDVHSGAGNCVCGSGLGDPLHVQAAPGVPIPKELRHAH